MRVPVPEQQSCSSATLGLSYTLISIPSGMIGSVYHHHFLCKWHLVCVVTTLLQYFPTSTVEGMVTYAFRGISYFLRHPALWKEVAAPLVLTLAFSLLAVYVLVWHMMSRQRYWLDDKKVPTMLADVLGVCIVVTEIFVTTFIYGVVQIDYFEDKIFAFVLRHRGLGYLLENHEHRSTAVRACTAYWLSRTALGFISLPLHLVPIIGSVVYAWLHGSVLAWEYHLFYFELKGIGYRQQHRWIRRYKLEYSAFGMQALLLQTIPLLGPFFIFSNTCGAALLAQDLERDKWQHGDEEQPLLSSSTTDSDEVV